MDWIKYKRCVQIYLLRKSTWVLNCSTLYFVLVLPNLRQHRPSLCLLIEPQFLKGSKLEHRQALSSFK